MLSAVENLVFAHRTDRIVASDAAFLIDQDEFFRVRDLHHGRAGSRATDSGFETVFSEAIDLGLGACEKRPLCEIKLQGRSIRTQL